MSKEKAFYKMMEVIYEVARKVNAYANIPRKYGVEEELYMVEVHTINVIGEKKHTNVSQIAKATFKTKGAVSQMIDKLIKKDIVVKYKNPEDNREVILELTEKGQKIYEYHKQKDKVAFDRYLSRLDEFTEEDFLKYIEISSRIFKLNRDENEIVP